MDEDAVIIAYQGYDIVERMTGNGARYDVWLRDQYIPVPVYAKDNKLSVMDFIDRQLNKRQGEEE